MDLKIEILEIIEANHKLTNGKCGITIPSLNNKINANSKNIRSILMELYKDNKIIVREGINGKMIFKKIQSN